MPKTGTRLLISTILGLASGIFCWFLMIRLHQGSADFSWAIRAARDLLARRNPYDVPSQLYPLSSALFGLPFVRMSAEVAAGIFYGLSTTLLAFGITRHGYHRLLIFLAFPYWAGMLTVQWIPLIMASAFFSLLLPVTLAKPQIGLPVAMTHLSRKGLIGCVLVLALSFVVMPHWVSLWLAHVGRYARFIPLFVLPGPLLAFALVRYRERDSWLLFLGACVPQRWFYDPFYLWLIPRTRRQIVYTASLSWIPGIWRWFQAPRNFTEVGRWTVLWMYLPMLVVLLLREPLLGATSEQEAPKQRDSRVRRTE